MSRRQAHPESRYYEGYREGVKDCFNDISKLFKLPYEGGYKKEELCHIFNIKPGNIKRETVVSKIINDYDIFDIRVKLARYEETHICRSCIHKCVCKLKPVCRYDYTTDTDVASMYPTKEWCEHFYNYYEMEKRED